MKSTGISCLCLKTVSIHLTSVDFCFSPSVFFLFHLQERSKVSGKEQEDRCLGLEQCLSRQMIS